MTMMAFWRAAAEVRVRRVVRVRDVVRRARMVEGMVVDVMLL